MSAAVSDESVAGDSGVYEACPPKQKKKEDYDEDDDSIHETPQVQIKLRYKKQDNLLFVEIERARNLGFLFIEDSSCKVCVKVQLFPAGPSTFTCCTHLDSDLNKPTFGETFSFVVSPRRLSSKTIQVNVWSVKDSFEIPEEECVGYAQISLADSRLETTPETRWYNILNYALLRPENIHSGRGGSGGGETAPVIPTSVTTSVASRDDLSSKSSTLRSSASNAKEESSDESTIISSQTSTLTRNVGPDALRLNLILPSEDDHDHSIIDSEEDEEEDNEDDNEDDEDEEDDDIYEEGEGGLLVRKGNNNMYSKKKRKKKKVIPLSSTHPLLFFPPGGGGGGGVLEEEEDEEDDGEALRLEEGEEEDFSEAALDKVLENAADTAVDGDSSDLFIETADKETNTECMFTPLTSSGVPVLGNIGGSGGGGGLRPGIAVIKRSQTFTPSAVGSKNSYICRLNRSDSDSCVPLNRKAPFQRGTAERKSLRWKGGKLHSTSSFRLSSKPSSSSGLKGPRTSLDLELDLAAQQLRLQQLQDEIESLRNLKSQLQGAKDSPELPTWASDSSTVPEVLSLATKGTPGVKTPEDRRMQKMLRRTSREIHKLRHSKTPRGQPDVISFKEKIAFFLKSNSGAIPPLNLDTESELEEETLEEKSVPHSLGFTTTSTTPRRCSSNEQQPPPIPLSPSSASSSSSPPSGASRGGDCNISSSSNSCTGSSNPKSETLVSAEGEAWAFRDEGRVGSDISSDRLIPTITSSSSSTSTNSSSASTTRLQPSRILSPVTNNKLAVNTATVTAQRSGNAAAATATVPSGNATWTPGSHRRHKPPGAGSILNPKVFHPEVLFDPDEKGVEV